MKHINISTEDAKYEYNKEENNKDLDDHSNHAGKEWENNGLFELDDKHNLVTDDDARIKNDEDKDGQYDVNELEAERISRNEEGKIWLLENDS